MDEATNAPKLYARYEALKRESADLKDRLGALCFCDDRKHPPVQAADMLGNVLLKTWRGIESKTGTVPAAYQRLTEVPANTPKAVHLLHFNLERLRGFAQLRKQRNDRMAMPDEVIT